MGKTPTKNKNLWSDNKLALEYSNALSELKQWIQIAKEWKSGIYNGNWKDALNARFIKIQLKEIISRIEVAEKYILKRNEINAQKGIELIPIVKWNNGNYRFTTEVEEKPKTQLQLDNDASLDEAFKDLMDE